jgi:hypothetical protein
VELVERIAHCLGSHPAPGYRHFLIPDGDFPHLRRHFAGGEIVLRRDAEGVDDPVEESEECGRVAHSSPVLA